MNWLNGRPEDWEDGKEFTDSLQYERGASAMLAAVIKWLWEDCNQHYGITHVRHLRHDCPQCMAELKESE